MALEMQNFEALSPPVVKKITWWTLLYRYLRVLNLAVKLVALLGLSLIKGI